MWKVFSANWFFKSAPEPEELAEDRFGLENLDIDRILDWSEPKAQAFPTFSRGEEDIPSPGTKNPQYSARSSMRVEPSKAMYFNKVSNDSETQAQTTPIFTKSKF